MRHVTSGGGAQGAAILLAAATLVVSLLSAVVWLLDDVGGSAPAIVRSDCVQGNEGTACQRHRLP